MNVVEHATEKVRQHISDDLLERMTSYSLTDAMREGAAVSKQAYNWCDESGDSLCAMSAAVSAARAREYMA